MNILCFFALTQHKIDIKICLEERMLRIRQRELDAVASACQMAKPGSDASVPATKELEECT